ncbi:ABC transporter substrate-binding protein [Cohnella terricola]|uniref:ABC transporter substrate-binding protein n=1 Tax=Cohnella terricola TaxID=1289167 RepID=A0A559JWI2_9BACL|nr:ABC transporter substrate-binding protein [Cohnella terricola]TVY04236.1 ABC transporter substrate-binding protein [Cohnella terricola]
MRKKTIVQTFIGLFAFAIILSGCSSNTNSNSNGSKGAESSPSASVDAASSPSASKGNKILIFGRNSDSVGLDLATTTDGESYRVAVNVLETLVVYDPTTKGVSPKLAESWTVSDDGLTYTFKLRQGIKFQDGTDFNAEAVAFNFERWMDKSNPLHNKDGFPYYESIFGGYKGDAQHAIAGITVADPYTVQFKLTKPISSFLSNLAIPNFGIASPEALKDTSRDFNKSPVGTGPFLLTDWKANDTITLANNPNYWQQGQPKLDKLIFKVIPDQNARLTALQTGEVDMIDGVNPEDVRTILQNGDLQLFDTPSLNVGYLGFNTAKAPFDNVKVREAIAGIVDKQALIDAFWAGTATPAVNAIPPVFMGYNGDIKDRTVDLDKSKQLLSEAGYPNGFKTTIWTTSASRIYMPNGEKVAQALQEQLKKINIDAQIQTLEWATYIDKLISHDTDLFLSGWISDTADPDNFLAPLFSVDNTYNFSGYKNEEVNKLLQQGQVETDSAKREQEYRDIQELLFQDAPVVPIAHAKYFVAAAKGVSGFVISPTGANESFADVDMN